MERLTRLVGEKEKECEGLMEKEGAWKRDVEKAEEGRKEMEKKVQEMQQRVEETTRQLQAKEALVGVCGVSWGLCASMLLQLARLKFLNMQKL